MLILLIILLLVFGGGGGTTVIVAGSGGGAGVGQGRSGDCPHRISRGRVALKVKRTAATNAPDLRFVIAHRHAPTALSVPSRPGSS
jgi:hypothetical protein